MFIVTSDKAHLDLRFIFQFLKAEAYWARERTLEQMRSAIENSICFGVYDGTRQVGFARVVSDRATFAYVGDVFIITEYRGLGLSKRLMEAIVGHPELQGLRRWVLATKDAHGLYEKFGFGPLLHPERWMERAAPNAY